jgi:serine/threonine protein phosphatase PrpC
MQTPVQIWKKNQSFKKWSVVGASVRGYSHLRSGAPREDAADYRAIDNDQALIVAVADGHGSKDCPLSNRGSKFAVEAALEYLENLYNTYKEIGDDEKSLFEKEYFLKKEQLVYLWQKKVEEDWKEESLPSNLYLQYGTTILAALFTEEFVFILHLGDGDILYLDESNNVARPLPDDPLCHQHIVTSLCLDKSWVHIRTQLLDINNLKPKLFMLATDGYNDSFEEEEAFFADLNVYWENFLAGENETETYLSEWLNNISEKGSGDDISTILIFFNNYKKELSEELSQMPLELQENDENE